MTNRDLYIKALVLIGYKKDETFKHSNYTLYRWHNGVVDCHIFIGKKGGLKIGESKNLSSCRVVGLATKAWLLHSLKFRRDV